MWDRCRSTALHRCSLTSYVCTRRVVISSDTTGSRSKIQWISMYEGSTSSRLLTTWQRTIFRGRSSCSTGRMRSSIADAVDLAEPHETYLNVLYR